MLKIIETEAEWVFVHALRKEELFARYSPHIVYDPQFPYPAACTHYVFYDGEKLLGTCILERLSDEEVAFRLIVIDPKERCKGYGALMLGEMEAIACAQGFRLILMHAALPAADFYRRHGYSEMDFDEPNANRCMHVDLGKFIEGGLCADEARVAR